MVGSEKIVDDIRYTKGEKAAQFATSDQKQPTIKRAFGGMYSKQAKTPGAKRLTRQEALLKRAFEEQQKELEEQRKKDQEKAVDEATSAAQSLIDLYQYSKTTQHEDSDNEDDEDEEYEEIDDDEDCLENDFPSLPTTTTGPRKRLQYQPPSGSILELSCVLIK